MQHSALKCFLTFSYVKKLQEDIKGKNASDPKTEEEKLKIIGLKTTSNIQTLIRDLFHSPPSFKSVVRLSWVSPKPRNFIKVKPADAEAAKEEEKPATAKRHAPITFDSSNGKSEDTRGAKKAKTGNGQTMYSPPGGKFSANIRGGQGRQGGNFGGNRSRNGGGGGNNRFRSGAGGGGRNRNTRNRY